MVTIEENTDEDKKRKQVEQDEEDERDKLEENLEEELDEEESREILGKKIGDYNANQIIELLQKMPQDISFVIGQFIIPKPSPPIDQPNAVITISQQVSYHFKKLLVEEATLGFFKLTTQLQRLFTFNSTPENKSQPFEITGLSENVNNEIDRWEVKENEGKGDCFFEALAYILNNNDETKNPIIPRLPDKETGRMNPIQGDNPYLTTSGTPRYNVYRLRKAVVDYLKIDTTSIDVLIASAPGDLPELVAKEKRINDQKMLQETDNTDETLTDYEKEDIRNYKWMLNKNNTEFMEVSKIIDVIGIPQNPTNRPGSINTIAKNKKLAYLTKNDTQGKHYWGDEIALFVLEKIFNIKFCPLYLPDAIKRNGRVYFQENGEKIQGTIKTISDDSYTIVTDLYEEYQKPKSSVMPSKTLELYPFGSALEPDEHTHIAFLYYTHESVAGGHYEAMGKKRFTDRYASSTLFSQDMIPSYLSFCIFRSICGFNQDGDFSFLQGDSPYLKFPRNSKNSLYKLISRMYNIYTSATTIQVGNTQIDKEIHRDDKTPKQLELQLGGAQQEVQKYLQTYLQNSPGANAKNTYYIVIDLNLFPDTGKPMTSLEKFRLRCGNTKDRIREAAADAFGLYYVPGEMDTSRLQDDVPLPEATPIEEMRIRSKTEKLPTATNTTRKNGGALKTRTTIKKKKRPKHKTRKFIYMD